MIISCSSNSDRNTYETINEGDGVGFKVSDSLYVIFQDSSNLRWIFENSELTKLNQKELVEIENIIQKAIDDNNKKQKRFLAERNSAHPNNQWTETGYELSTEGYYRQYMAVLNERGEKEVWINFFCDVWGSTNWRSDILIVDDGGNCYFNLKVNLAKGTYYDLRINGYA